jgi:hypothetical protein
VHKVIYNNSKVNCPEEKLFGKSPKRGPSGPLRRNVRDTRLSLRQNQCKNTSLHYELSDGKASTVRDQARTVRPTARTEPENSKVTGSVKWIIASSRTIRGARPDRPRLPLSDNWRHIKCYIVVDIVVTAERCDFSRWCAGADRPDQGHGPSAVGRKEATGRKWLGAINTTPTTSIHNNPSIPIFHIQYKS